jgi:hypothetical protein
MCVLSKTNGQNSRFCAANASLYRILLDLCADGCGARYMRVHCAGHGGVWAQIRRYLFPPNAVNQGRPQNRAAAVIAMPDIDR